MMFSLLLKVGVVATVLIMFSQMPGVIIHYAKAITLVGGTILVLLHVGGLKEGLRYLGILVVAYVIVLTLLGGSWSVPMYGDITKRFQAYAVQHHGIDISGNIGEPIYSAKAGKVSKVWNDDIYGLVALVDHESGLQTLYGHLNEITVEVGEKVKMGQQIGSCGSSGKSSGPHLHFEIREEGKTVDPEKYIRFLSIPKEVRSWALD